MEEMECKHIRRELFADARSLVCCLSTHYASFPHLPITSATYSEFTTASFINSNDEFTDNSNMKRIAIIGSSGFYGRAVVRDLREHHPQASILGLDVIDPADSEPDEFQKLS